MEDGLDEQALKAVSKAQFNPAMLGGQRVPDRVAIGISFASY
jgi:outer membrane biosynthesis protein TonB